MASIKLIHKGEGFKRASEAFSPKTVKIGDQVWMAENLAVDDGGDGIYRNEETGELYYTWDAATRIAANMPGWHLPTSEEWVAAAAASGADAVMGYDSSYFGDYRGAQDLKTKLGVKLVGYFADRFRYVGDMVYFWTSEMRNPSEMYIRTFDHGTTMGLWHVNNEFGNSVRLVKD